MESLMFEKRLGRINSRFDSYENSLDFMSSRSERVLIEKDLVCSVYNNAFETLLNKVKFEDSESYEVVSKNAEIIKYLNEAIATTMSFEMMFTAVIKTTDYESEVGKKIILKYTATSISRSLFITKATRVYIKKDRTLFNTLVKMLFSKDRKTRTSIILDEVRI